MVHGPWAMVFVCVCVCVVLCDHVDAHLCVCRLRNNLENPYPKESEKRELASQAGIEVAQVSTWFINARVRELKRLKKEASLPRPPVVVADAPSRPPSRASPRIMRRSASLSASSSCSASSVAPCACGHRAKRQRRMTDVPSATVVPTAVRIPHRHCRNSKNVITAVCRLQHKRDGRPRQRHPNNSNGDDGDEEWLP